MPEHQSEYKGKKYTTFALLSDLVVYQPAKPIRVVQVAVNDGKYQSWDLPFMGVRTFIKNEYTRDGHRTPEGAMHTSLIEGGFQLRSTLGHEVETDILVWCDEYQAIVTLEEMRCGNTREIAGIASQPTEWWDEQIKAAAKELGSETPEAS